MSFFGIIFLSLSLVPGHSIFSAISKFLLQSSIVEPLCHGLFAPIIALLIILIYWYILSCGIVYLYDQIKDLWQKSIIQKPLLIVIIAASVIVIGYKIISLFTSTTDWFCGDPIVFSYKGELVTYGTVESLGRCWLDRNLGASRRAKGYDDEQAYGDLFQWGRLDDGHQDRNSVATTTLSSSNNPGHSEFIYGMDDPYDWRDPQNDNLWQGVSGINNPCPNGWRLPTRTEWKTEQASWDGGYLDGNDYDKFGAYWSPLKLTTAGKRFYHTSEVTSTPEARARGHYWSSTINTDGEIYYMQYRGDTIWPSARAFGLPVRCIKD